MNTGSKAGCYDCHSASVTKSGYCSACQGIRNREYRKANKESISEYTKKYTVIFRKENPEYMKKYNKALYVENREEMQQRSKQWFLENPEEKKRITRKYNLKKLYSMTLDQYDTLLRGQKGVCAICLEAPKTKSLFVDHCHKTGRVRGLLCHKCNAAIGFLKEDPRILERAQEYLRG